MTAYELQQFRQERRLEIVRGSFDACWQLQRNWQLHMYGRCMLCQLLKCDILASLMHYIRTITNVASIEISSYSNP